MHYTDKPTYMPHIDGLRALAVLIIILFHLDVPYITGGFIGVDIFFVISGYLITNIISREIKEGKFSFANFYSRRIKRIFPALFFMLFITSLIALIFLEPQQFNSFFKALRMVSGQISNIFFSREVDYFAVGSEASPLLHTWSLGVEEQFYLLWPLIMVVTYKLFGIKKMFISLILILLLSLAVSEYLVQTDAMSAFYLLHSRAWELALGSIIALKIIPEIKKRSLIEILSVLGLLLIIIPIFFYEKNMFPGIKAILPCLGAALIIYSAHHKTGFVHKAISFKYLVYIGLISYSLYLWHWPLIAFYKGYTDLELSISVQITIFIVSFILAYISYKFIETPFRYTKLSSKKVIAIGLGTILIFIIGSNLVKGQRIADWRIEYSMGKDVLANHELNKICAGEGGAYNREQCIIGDNKEKYEVIIVGDSHAWHYSPTVMKWAENNNLTIRLFLRGACKTWVQSDEIRMKAGKIDTYCMDLVKNFYKILDEDNHIKYIFLAQMLPDGSDDIHKSLIKLKSYNKNIYFLGQTPFFENDPHACRMKNSLRISQWVPRNKRDCTAIDPSFSLPKIKETQSTLLPILEELDIPYFDPYPMMEKPFDDEGRFLFKDSNHMNSYGALYLEPYLSDFIKENPPKF